MYFKHGVFVSHTTTPHFLTRVFQDKSPPVNLVDNSLVLKSERGCYAYPSVNYYTLLCHRDDKKCGKCIEYESSYSLMLWLSRAGTLTREQRGLSWEFKIQ